MWLLVMIAFTYEELYQAIGKLTPYQRSIQVRGWDEGLMVRVTGLKVLEDDYADLGDGYEPVGNPADSGFDREVDSYFPKNYPILEVEGY